MFILWTAKLQNNPVKIFNIKSFALLVKEYKVMLNWLIKENIYLKYAHACTITLSRYPYKKGATVMHIVYHHI